MHAMRREGAACSTCSSPTTTASAGCSPSSRRPTRSDDTDSHVGRRAEDLRGPRGAHDASRRRSSTRRSATRTTTSARPSTRACRSTTSSRSCMAEIKQLPDGSDEWVAKMHRAHRERRAPRRGGGEGALPAAAQQLAADVSEQLAERLEAARQQLGAPILADKIDLTKEELLDARPRAADPRPLLDEPGRARRHRRPRR